jgi:hypothetical protein
VSKQSAERPILFQTEMVKAILEGRKTQTRRVVKNIELKEGKVSGKVNFTYQKNKRYEAGINVSPENLNLPFTGIVDLCNYGKPGDLLWVRETWCFNGTYYIFKSDHESMPFRWKTSIHMPKSAARIWLMVEDIRVERLNDIREDDARNEGVLPSLISTSHTVGLSCKYSFAVLWESINGKESWNSNPWVWVIQFRVLSTTGKPTEEVIEQNFKEIAPLRFEMGQIRNEIENTVLFKGRKEASHV